MAGALRRMRCRYRDRRDALAIREGRSFIFRCREDVQTVLAHEHYLETRAI